MIRLSGLSKSFGRLKVLAGLELTIERGERVALVGSNGAGKTTLMRCLLGEYTHGGQVKIAEHSPREHRRLVLSRVGFVPQLPPPLKMPVGELLRFSAAVGGTAVRDIEALAARLGLETKPFAHIPFLRLSGGQKQKLLIAIALGRRAEVLILDEPAANLDPEARHAFFALLAERAEVSTMLISSHRLDEVAAIVNRVIELDRGQVVLDDRVSDGALTGLLRCSLTLRRVEPAVAKALGDWGFKSDAGGLDWEGVVAGADRLRFMGLLSRYVGLLRGVRLDEDERPLLKAVE